MNDTTRTVRAAEQARDRMTDTDYADALRRAAGHDADQPRRLPIGWRRLSTARLEELLAELDDSTGDYDDALDELNSRSEAAADHRVAQAIGAAHGDLPS